jgi:hypothetical protein
MNNETFETRLIREHTPEPLEGHTVVVFERVGAAGERFHTVLPPGTPMARGGLLQQVFGRRVDYFAYAVNAAPELHLDFSEHVVTADHAHDMDLLFGLYYCVDDPRLVAGTRNADPLGTVRKKVGAVIAAEIAELPWNAVWHSFRASADTVVHDNLRLLRSFAAQYGIGIRSVELGLQLPEEETSTVRKVHRGIADVRMETELKRAQMEEQETIDIEKADSARRVRLHGMTHDLHNAALEDQALALQHRRRLLNDMSGAGSEALRNIGKNITSATELREAIRAGRGALQEMAGGADAQVLLGAGETGAGLSLPASPQGRLAGLVQELVAATRDVNPGAVRNALRAAVLHLVAEVLADGAGDSTRRDEYAQRAHSLVSGLDPFPGDEAMEVLRRLSDPALLRRALHDL